MKIDTSQVMNLVQALRPLSSEASRLLTLMSDEDHSVRDIVQIVECDPALTAHVLKVVNSAAFALSRRVGTLDTAVSFLGDSNIVGIALAAAGGEVFNAELAGYEGTRGDLGKHCLWTAIGARELAQHTASEVNGGIAFTAGLLHDIGKVVISDLFEGGACGMVQGIESREYVDFIAAEQDAVGTDHAEVGSLLAEHWNLPEQLRETILYHHDPAQADPRLRHLVYIVHMADILSMMGGYGTGADAMQYTLDPNYQEYVDIQPDLLESVVLNTQIDFNKTVSSMFGDEDNAGAES